MDAGLRKGQKRWVCRYNAGCVCYQQVCGDCGWIPAVARRRSLEWIQAAGRKRNAGLDTGQT